MDLHAGVTHLCSFFFFFSWEIFCKLQQACFCIKLVLGDGLYLHYG